MISLNPMKVRKRHRNEGNEVDEWGCDGLFYEKPVIYLHRNIYIGTNEATKYEIGRQMIRFGQKCHV